MLGKYEFYCLGNEQEELSTCTLTTLITTKCTYNCSYCGIRKLKGQFISEENFESILSFIEAQKRKKVKLIISGGEPSLHPLLSTFIQKAVNKFSGIQIQLNTNLSLAKNIYLNLPEYDLKLNCTYHEGLVKDDEAWFDKLYALKQKYETRLYIMLEPHNVERIKKLYFEHKDKIFTGVMPVSSFRKEANKMDWFIKDIGYDHMLSTTAKAEPPRPGWKHERNFFGMLCAAEFIVNEYGDCWSCWSKFGYEGYQPSFNVFRDPTKKIKRLCWCSSKECKDGFHFPKYSVKKAAKMSDLL